MYKSIFNHFCEQESFFWESICNFDAVIVCNYVQTTDVAHMHLLLVVEISDYSYASRSLDDRSLYKGKPTSYLLLGKSSSSNSNDNNSNNNNNSSNQQQQLDIFFLVFQ